MYLYKHKSNKMYRGEFLGIFFVFCFGCRGLLEFTKDPSVTLFTIGDVVINMGHALSLPFIIAGIVIWVGACRRKVPVRIVRKK